MNLYSPLPAAQRLATFLHTVLLRTALKGLGKSSSIETRLRIHGPRYISIGEKTFIGSDSWLCAQPQAASSSGKNLANSAVIAIGSNVSISGHCTISAVDRVVIEDGVLIARYAYIADHTHEYGDIRVPIKDQGICKIAPVTIRQGAWLGQNVVICPGVTVGQNSVVAANSIVRESVPDFTVVAGSPARPIKTLTSASQPDPTP